MVLIYDDFRRDNAATLRAVLRFLAVEDRAPIDTAEANPTVRVRSRRLNHLIFREQGPAWRTVRTAVKPFMPQQARRHMLEMIRDRIVYASPRPAEEELMMELRRRFKPEVVALSNYLGRDLVSLWGYDRIG